MNIVPETQTYQIHTTTNKGILHTRTILSTTTTNQNNTVLLDIVAYENNFVLAIPLFQSNCNNLTFTRDISRNNLPGTQAHTSNLPLTRVRLLRLGNTSLKTNTLKPRRSHKRR
jgi:hypothetical protein